MSGIIIGMVTGGIFFCVGFVSAVIYWARRGFSPGILPPREIWAISIYEGVSPFKLLPSQSAQNPVISAKDVRDAFAYFTADPFLIFENGQWYMFFEVWDLSLSRGVISYATSCEGYQWKYQKVILKENFHLSYPYVFKQRNKFYMIPETCETQSIRIYEAVRFPGEWKLVKTLVSGRDFLDNSVIQHEGFWWMFSGTDCGETLRLFFSDDLLGDWKEHPQSPLLQKDPYHARPAGRVLKYQDRLIRLAQSLQPVYGYQTFAYQIEQLTVAKYQEQMISHGPILKAACEGWNACGMHHLDATPKENGIWLGCVDGHRSARKWERHLEWGVAFTGRVWLRPFCRYVYEMWDFLRKICTLINWNFQRIQGERVRMRVPDREVLEDVIFPYFASRADFQSILFVGCDWYTKDYQKIFSGKKYWTLDPDAKKRVYGSKDHLAMTLENLGQASCERPWDVIFCNGVVGWGLDFKENAEKAFEACFQALRPGGILMIGWDDVPERTPFFLTELSSLKRFTPFSFPPLKTEQYRCRVDYRHTYSFYQKPAGECCVCQ